MRATRDLGRQRGTSVPGHGRWLRTAMIRSGACPRPCTQALAIAARILLCEPGFTITSMQNGRRYSTFRRCRYAVDESGKALPPLVEIEPGHHVACFNPVPADEWIRTRAVPA